ncbi:hypothetical protein LP419_19255 [Massilia sp. H-1]|nr:hypothetical protein LP419_19255 [Massilia sp. H-1]
MALPVALQNLSLPVIGLAHVHRQRSGAGRGAVQSLSIVGSFPALNAPGGAARHLADGSQARAG